MRKIFIYRCILPPANLNIVRVPVYSTANSYVMLGTVRRIHLSKLQGLDVDVLNTYYHQQKGLNAQEQIARQVLNPFYVFQIFSVALWFAYDYYYYACVIVLMSVFGITMSIVQTKKNQDALRETVHNTGTALIVSEKGETQELPTQCLVPGDIIEIPSSGCTMQCDAVLLSGNCILDESMLTGESVPVTKTPLPSKRDVIFDKKEHARHTLFCGTKVIQTRLIGTDKVLAIVINTGNITAKGGLIRSILYPPPVDYKFEQDSYKFIEFLGLIALIGFIYTLVSKILRNVDPVKIAVESLDLIYITIVVPPALPAAMTVGRFYAQKRLERNSIYCISPRSINTGTLTEDGLDMWGVVPKSATNQFQIPIKQIDRLPCDNFLFGMVVTCHSITVMNGKMMGDPLDLKMFESTGWTLEDPQGEPNGMLQTTIVRQPKQSKCDQSEEGVENKAPHIRERQSSVDDLLSDVGLLNGEHVNDHGIVREFPFTSNLQRMSVVTRRLCEKNFNVYCKGSPEMLQQLCVPSSLPDNFSQQLAIFAKQGYRVIAMAYKKLNPKINFTKVQRLARENVECDLEFLGFVVLENRLKPDTTEVIGALTKAEIRTIMVTGDNILTALSVARDCGIVSSTQPVVTVNIREKVPASCANSSETNAGPSHGKNWRDNYRFAMVGKTWQIVKDHFPDLLQNFLTRGVIYARMSPEQKQALIVELQNLDYCVAMCGDGANDCGALKVAHTGISLSETESSIASPFTSRNPTIAAVPNVIKEGRAALVTSFDLGLISIFAFFFGKTESFQGPLVKQVPLSSLISLTPLSSIVLHLIVVIAFQVAGWYHLHQQDWFVPFVSSNEDHLGCWENYTMFAISSFQYIILAFVFFPKVPMTAAHMVQSTILLNMIATYLWYLHSLLIHLNGWLIFAMILRLKWIAAIGCCAN
ncbi:hypothetical protein DOY81_009808, partial [Sarcophaga bullata]